MTRVGLGLVLLVLTFAATGSDRSRTVLITAPTHGPYHVRGNRILDGAGREHLIRGTSLAALTPPALAIRSDFGAFSRTTLITIRQRQNMNAVRLRVDAAAFVADPVYRRAVSRIVRDANELQLLAIVGTNDLDPSAAYWKACVEEFHANSDVIFSASSGEGARALRAAGATQPIVIPAGEEQLEDTDLIREVRPLYASFDADRRKIDSLSERFAVLVDGADPDLEHSGGECAAFPGDPTSAASLVEHTLQDFDERAVSWTLSTLRPGVMIDNYQGYTWMKLDDGWTCGERPARGGIAMALLSHLWSADPHGVFTVNLPGGGAVIARGAHASAYGRILAERAALAPPGPLPLRLANIAVRVTDSRGVARMAPMSWTGPGWANTNFLIPVASATGPATVTIVRSEGSESSSRILIADVAPALWTATTDGRGPVIADVRQRFADGHVLESRTWTDGGYAGRLVPVPLTRRAVTTVRLHATGLRYARTDSVKVRIDDLSIPADGFGPLDDKGLDQVTFRMSDSLIGRGEVDLFLTVGDALSNVVRIHCGKAGG